MFKLYLLKSPGKRVGPHLTSVSVLSVMIILIYWLSACPSIQEGSGLTVCEVGAFVHETHIHKMFADRYSDMRQNSDKRMYQYTKVP